MFMTEGRDRCEKRAPMETVTEELRSDTWVDYFKTLAAVSDAPLVAVEVLSDRPGRNLHSARRLKAIGYDAESDVLHLDVGGRSAGDAVVLRHFISEPQTIRVDGLSPFKPTVLLVKDASGARTQISFLNRQASRPECEIVGLPHRARRTRRRSRYLTTDSSG
jgi:hypothetical protein